MPQVTLYYYDPPHHDKVYILTNAARTVTSQWGRYGASLQSKVLHFVVQFEADLVYERLLSEKLAKGYRRERVSPFAITAWAEAFQSIKADMRPPAKKKAPRTKKEDPIEDRPRRKFRLD